MTHWDRFKAFRECSGKEKSTKKLELAKMSESLLVHRVALTSDRTVVFGCSRSFGARAFKGKMSFSRCFDSRVHAVSFERQD